MAQVKNYGLIGVGNDVQLGKQGPRLVANADTGTISVTNEGGVATTMSGADGVNASDFITKSQLDALEVNLSGSGFNIQLGNIDANGDLDWHITPDQGDYAGNTGVTRQGAVTSFTNNTTVSEAVDRLNEAALNIYNNTFVRDVNFTVDNSTGGAPLVSTLTISTTGNPTHYTIDWGDGTTTTATTDSTPTHTYSNNSQSPFDVSVTAYNENGAGEGSTTTFVKSNFITLYTANPVADFNMYAANTGGLAVSIVDDGTALYFDNDTTNIGSADATYTIEWGDGSANSNISADTDAGGTQGNRLAHTFTTSTEEDQQYTVKLTLDTHSTADPSVIPNNATAIIKVYDTHTPDVSLASNSGINEQASGGFQVAFTNNTESTIGSNADFGIYYVYNWGDGTTSTVATGGGAAGDTGQAINHTYTLSSTDQNNGTAVDYTGNLQVYSAHTGSPFTSSNFTVHVEPDLRADITASSTTSSLKSSNDSIRTVYKGTDLSGTNRAVITVDNTTSPRKSGVQYQYSWGDGTANVTVTEVNAPVPPDAGTVLGANITHDYSNATTGSKTLTMQATGTLDITAQSSTVSETIVVEDVPTAPAGVSSKSLTLSTNANHGSSAKLASGAVDNAGSSLSAGDSLSTDTARRYDTTTSISTDLISDAYNSYNGNVSAYIDGVADGTKQFTSATGETGTFTSLIITSEGDAHDEISTSTYPDNFYQVFTGRITKDISSLDHGVHTMYIGHDSTGNTNNVHVVYDNVNTVPTLDISGASLQENTNGSLRYVSGVPYYNSGSPTVKLVGATVTNLIGQAYKDDSGIFNIKSGTNTEGSGTAVVQNSRSYSQIDGAVSMLSGGIPTANVGVGSAYALGNISIDVNNNNCVEPIKFNIENLMGSSADTAETSEQIQVWASAPTFDEGAIPVSDSLGAGFTDDGVRITGFGSSADTPAFDNSVNNYTANVWSGAETIAGTAEAVNRFNTLTHYDTDLSSGYLPVGPDLATGRSGAQYFTFAFRRTTMSNFDITLTGSVSGLWIAAPGTDIDNASGLNGWLHAGTTYGGAGTPGSNTGSGGNGSDGCAFTSGDRIVDGSTYSSNTFTMTLGDQNATNSTGNNILVRVKLEDGDSLTALSIS